MSIRGGSGEEMNLDLRSSQTTSSLQSASSSTGGPVMAESSMSDRSQQVSSPMSQPSLFRTAQSNLQHKEGLELTDPHDVVSYTSNNLPHSRFLPSGHADAVPDDVFLEKQRAQEKALREGKCSAQGMDISFDDSCKTHRSDTENYQSYPVQESGNLNRENYVSDNKFMSSMETPPSMSTEMTDISTEMGLTSTSSYSGGTQPTSVVHESSQEMRWENIPELAIRPEEYPPQFKEGQYDCVLIYSENDSQMAVNFKDMLQKFVMLEDRNAPAICILDRNDNLQYIQSRFKHADEAMERSTYMFLFITEDFVADAWADMQKDECLMESIRLPEKKWCVVPLHTQKKKDLKFRYPYGLRALKGVDISAILPGKKLATLDVRKLQREDVDSYFLDNITKMFNQRLKHRFDRQREHELQLQEWINDERESRFKKLILEEHNKKVERLKVEKERTNLQMALAKDTEAVRQKLEKMEVPIIGSSGNINTQMSLPNPGSGQSKHQSKDPKSMIRELLSMEISLEDAVDLVQEELGMAKTSSGMDKGQVMKVLKSFGFSLPEAMKLIKESDQKSAMPAVAGGPTTVHITNYGGNVQVGPHGSQTVQTESDPSDDRSSVMDSGVEFDVQEMSIEDNDPPPVYTSIPQRPLLTSRSPDGSLSSASALQQSFHSKQQPIQNAQDFATKDRSVAELGSKTPMTTSVVVQPSLSPVSAPSDVSAESSLTGRKARYNESFGRSVEEDVSEHSVSSQNPADQRLGFSPFQRESAALGSSQGQSSTSGDLQNDRNMDRAGNVDSQISQRTNVTSSTRSCHGQNGDMFPNSQEYDFLSDDPQVDSAINVNNN